MRKPYTVLALFEAKPGKESELKEVFLGLIEPTKQEPGCIDYVLHQDLKNPKKFMFYENFVDEAAHEEHCKTPHILAWQARMDELLAAPFEVTIWERC